MPTRFRIVGLLSVIIALAAIPSTAAASVGGCDLYASPAGSDTAGGTASSPFKTVQHLADALVPGQVGCLREGTYEGYSAPGETFKQLKVTRPNISLTSAPGEQARIDARVWIAQGANGVTFENLYLDGANSKTLPSPTVNAENDVFRHDEVTNDHTGICFTLGITGYGEARGTLIEGNRIHACGALPSTNQHHGIYVADAENTMIRDNWIYDNVNRGIQLYPNAQKTTITGNVIYGNGEGIIFSGDATEASSGSMVTHNVIADAQIRSNVESFYEAGAPIGANNVVKENCTYGAASSYYAGSDNSGVQQPQVGFTASNNIVTKPVFVNAAKGDFRLISGNGCASDMTASPDGQLPGLTTSAPAPTPETPAPETPAPETPTPKPTPETPTPTPEASEPPAPETPTPAPAPESSAPEAQTPAPVPVAPQPTPHGKHHGKSRSRLVVKFTHGSDRFSVVAVGHALAAKPQTSARLFAERAGSWRLIATAPIDPKSGSFRAVAQVSGSARRTALQIRVRGAGVSRSVPVPVS